MEIIKCENGHYFDIETYKTCPHCGAGVASEVDIKKKKAEKKSFWPFNKKTQETPGPVTSETYARPVGNDNVTVSLKPEELPGGAQRTAATPTVALPLSQLPGGAGQNGASSQTVALPISQLPGAGSQTSDVPVQQAAVPPVTNPGSASEQAGYTAAQPAPAVTSAREAVGRVSAAEEGKTLSFFSLNRGGNQNQSAKPAQETADQSGVQNARPSQEDGTQTAQPVTEPPVGWLVCIKGPHIGQCFNVYSGRNSIGRNSSNRIVIGNDLHVSREKHAWISYEPRKKKFTVMPGDGSGLTYLNDEDIMSPNELKKGDKIELGETMLLFVPLCGEDFSWEDYL